MFDGLHAELTISLAQTLLLNSFGLQDKNWIKIQVFQTSDRPRML